MLEPARATLYRTFLLVSLPFVGLLGLTFRLTALTVMVVALFAMLVLAWVASRLRLRGIAVRRELYPSAFEEDAVGVDVGVENRRAWSAHLLEVSDHFGPGMADRQILLEPGPLRPMRRRRLSYTGYCSRHWGVYVVGPVELTAGDAAGLFHATRAFAQVDMFSVFPRVHEVAGLERMGAIGSLAPQDVTAGRPGQSSVFLGARDWRPGDALRRVHWPATARRGSLVVKEYEVDLVPYFTLFLDLDRAHRAGTGRKSTLEYVVRTAASLVWTAVRRGDVVQAFGEGSKPLFVPPGSGQVHLAVALNELIHAQQDGTVALADLVERHVAHLPPGSTACVLSGTVALEHARLAELLEMFRSRGVRPLMVFVNSWSFAPVDKWPLPRAEAQERCRELEYFLRSRGVAGCIVGIEHELEAEFARAELFLSPEALPGSFVYGRTAKGGG